MRRVSVAVPAMISALVAVGAAAGSGGTSIASAPVVQPGVQLSGDTSTDATANGSIGSEESTGCWNDVEYRRLPFTAGAQVLTTDRNIGKVIASRGRFPQRAPIRFAARSSGTYAAGDRTDLLQRDGRALHLRRHRPPRGVAPQPSVAAA